MDKVQVVGIIAGILTAISMLPQLIKIIREKKAEEVSALMLLVLITGNILWAAYGMLREDWPIIATNGCSILINSLTIFFRMRYRER